MSRRRSDLGAMLAIMAGAGVWGVIWYPLRMLAGLGVSGALAAGWTGLAACVFMACFAGRELRWIPRHGLILALILAAGLTNIGFTWGVIHGEVMRVCLLFYLSPVWTALFAHLMLRERLTPAGACLGALSLCGAGLMLWSPQSGLPFPASAADWAGLVAGMGYAMNNVLTLKISQTWPTVTPKVRTFLVFLGSAGFGFAVSRFDHVLSVPAAFHLGPVLGLVLAMGVSLALGNLLVQHGLVRVAANRAALVMLFEIVVTVLSSWLLAGEVPGPREAIGGACIVLSAVLASCLHRENPPDRPSAKAAMV